MVDELRAAVRELADAPSAELADSLVDGLARASPSPELATFITETLERPAMHEVRDSRGVPVRWSLVDRLLTLGFPHALLVAPEDLDYHKSRGRPQGALAATATAAIAFVSMLWSFLWGALALGAGSGWEMRLALALTVAAFFHGLLALGSAVRAAYGREAPLLKPLGWTFVVVPLVSFGLEGAHTHLGAAAFWLGLPAMLTALLCAATAAVSRPVPRSGTPLAEGELPQGARDHPGPARIAVR